MRFLKSFGPGLGALLIVLALIMGMTMPGQRAYPLAVGGFGLLLAGAGLYLDRRRVASLLSGRVSREAGTSVGYSLTVLAILVLVNFLAGRHSARLDLTSNKAFTLGEQTIKVLESLPRDVRLTAFYRVGMERQKPEDLLKEYRHHTSRLSYEFVDPDSHPAEARRYGITEYGTIVVESGKREERVNLADEESLTNALIKVTRDRESVVYVTGGHGERSLTDNDRAGLSSLKEALERQHYRVEPLTLTQGVPEDAAVVLIPGASKPFLPAEAGMIRAFLDRGGRVFYLQDPDTTPGLDDVLAAYGVTVRHDVVVDKVSQMFGGDPLSPLVPAEGYDRVHSLTKTFTYQTFYPLASSVDVHAALPEGVTVTQLARTTDYAWGESSRAEIDSGRIRLDEGADTRGPITIGAAVVKRSEAPGEAGDGKEEAGKKDEPARVPEARLLIFGDSDFMSNAYFNAAGNGDLALSGVAWLAEQEDLVSIRPKSAEPRLVVLSRQQIFYYFWTIVALAPIAITTVGIGIWWRRKKL